MEFLRITEDRENIIRRLVELEQNVFGLDGGADFWMMKTFMRYGYLFLIQDGEEIISVAQYLQVAEKSEVYLYGFLTVEKFRRKGFARMILEKSEEYLKGRGIESISLTVAPENARALNIYINDQFKVTEFMKDEYGKGVDRYFMRKILL